MLMLGWRMREGWGRWWAGVEGGGGSGGGEGGGGGGVGGSVHLAAASPGLLHTTMRILSPTVSADQDRKVEIMTRQSGCTVLKLTK